MPAPVDLVGFLDLLAHADCPVRLRACATRLVTPNRSVSHSSRLARPSLFWCGPMAGPRSVTDLSDSDAESLDAPTLPLPGATARQRRGVEVFCGSGRLATALARRGVLMDKYDLALGGAQHDLTSNEVVDDLTSKATSSEWDYGHFAPPCNTYSVARYPRIRSGPVLSMCGALVMFERVLWTGETLLLEPRWWGKLSGAQHVLSQVYEVPGWSARPQPP